MAEHTTLPVSKSTKKQLAELGSKAETWDELLSRLAEEAE